MKANLYFVTNRNHLGDNQWKPLRYGRKFSSDGHFNLRFGDLSIDYDPEMVSGFLHKKFPGEQSGDGENLAVYLSKQAAKADITAYEDFTSTTNKNIPPSNNSSTKLFKSLKEKMQQSGDLLIYIHGYNVSWEDAVGSALSLEFMLNRKKKNGDKKIMVLLFTWPSDGSIMPFAAYKSDRSDARDSAQAVGRGFLKVRDFLSGLKDNHADGSMKPCHRCIHLLCHSMGNYVLQNSLKKLIGYSNGNRLPRIFENIFLCAADVDDDAMEKEDKMGKVHELCNHLTVYFNHGDLGMYISDYTKGHPQRLGQTGLAHPQLVHNKIQQVDCTPVVRGLVEHSYYLWAMVNDDISMTLDGVPFDDEKRLRKQLANSREWRLISKG